MGTSQSISSGVSGEPNWGKTSSSASNLANKVKKEKENPDLANNRPFQDRKNGNIKKLLGNYVKAVGGRGSISSGGSSKGGKAALNTAISLAGALNFVSANGLDSYLSNKGVTNFSERSNEDIINFLLEDICGSTSTFDDAAAKNALDTILEKIFEDAEDGNEDTDPIKDYLESHAIEYVIVEFYGTYIFDHLFQPIQEKLFESKGEDICHATMEDVKEYIQNGLEGLRLSDSLNDINWDSNTEVETLMSNIFDNVIEVFEDE